MGPDALVNDERRVTREGIHIDREVADAVAIEEELDSNVVGPYRFPSPMRRRTPALIYTLCAAAVAIVIDPPPALILAPLAVWHLMGAWPLQVDQEQALATAAKAVQFSIGHASAAVTFHGVRARPRWSVILYSAVDPPDKRALVRVDAVSGHLSGEPFVETLT
ncbi:hypothetical protein BH23ACT5_BH23ACT5_21000 [soil metagenome]